MRRNGCIATAVSGLLWCQTGCGLVEVVANRIGNGNGDTPATAGKAVSFSFLPGVVVDPNRDVVYLMNPDGGVEAVSLAGGAVRWTARAADKPLIATDVVLIAQQDGAAALMIVVLNVDEGGKTLQEIPIELPDGVSASVDEGLGHSFRADARLHNGDVIIEWRFTSQQISGADPGDEATARQAQGAARINLQTGEVEILSPSQVPPATELALPGNVAGLVSSGALPGTIWQVGNVFATLIRRPEQNGDRFVLRRFRVEDGEPLADVDLFGSEWIPRFASADSRHFLASRPDDDGTGRWRWAVFSLETGDRVAEVNLSVPEATFFLWRSTLIYLGHPDRQPSGASGMALQAVDSRTGQNLWQRAVRDTSFRGPSPPGVPGSQP